MKKSTFSRPTLTKVRFLPSTLEPGKSPSLTFQTVYFTFLERFRTDFATVNGGFAIVMVVLYFFLFNYFGWIFKK